MSKVTVRELNEIQADYQQTCAKAGQAQYQLIVLKKELDTLNDKLLDLNKEAHARNLLNSKKGKKKAVEVELPEQKETEKESTND